MTPFPDVPADPARDLPREAFREIMRILHGALPPPTMDGPADRARRDRAAMAAVAALLPETAAEGRLAAQFVAADAWAMDCLRLAGEKRLEPEVARKCRAQAMSLMREAKSALRLLQKMQAARQAMVRDDAAADRAAWVEHGVAAMMAAALADVPASAPATAGATDARRQDETHEAAPVFETRSPGMRRETEPGRWRSPALARDGWEAGPADPRGKRAPALSSRPADHAAGAVAAV